jgi:hypothetical protein
MEGFGEPRLNLGTGRENCTLSQPPSERRPRLLRTLPDAPTNLFPWTWTNEKVEVRYLDSNLVLVFSRWSLVSGLDICSVLWYSKATTLSAYKVNAGSSFDNSRKVNFRHVTPTLYLFIRYKLIIYLPSQDTSVCNPHTSCMCSRTSSVCDCFLAICVCWGLFQYWQKRSWTVYLHSLQNGAKRYIGTGICSSSSTHANSINLSGRVSFCSSICFPDFSSCSFIDEDYVYMAEKFQHIVSTLSRVRRRMKSNVMNYSSLCCSFESS